MRETYYVIYTYKNKLSGLMAKKCESMDEVSDFQEGRDLNIIDVAQTIFSEEDFE